MKSIVFRKVLVGAALAGAGVGCVEGGELTGIVEHFYTLRVLAPPGGADRYMGAQGGQVVVMLRVENGDNVKTEIYFSTTAPEGVTARVVPLGLTADVVLEPNEVRELRMLVNIGAGRAPGPITVGVNSTGESTRTDIDGRDFTSSESVSVEMTVVADGAAPAVVISDPNPREQFSTVPIAAFAQVTDDGGLLEVTYQLSDQRVEYLFEHESDDDPRAALDARFELLSPVFGANTLVVTARDALGQLGEDRVDFFYEPTGQCESVTVISQVSSLTGAPGEHLRFVVTVTPRNGWTGNLQVNPGRGLMASASNEVLPNVTGPTETLAIVTLRRDLVPGTEYGLIVSVVSDPVPTVRCEIAVPLQIVDPGLGAAPDVTIETPEDGLVTGASSVTLTGVVTDDGEIIRVYYDNRDDQQPATDILTGGAASPFTFTESVPLVPGENTIRVVAIDDEGRSSGNVVSVTYDPEVSGQCTEFTLDASPAELVAQRGSTDYAGILVTPIGGFAGEITLSIEEPFAAQLFTNVSFSPNPTVGNSTMGVTVTNGPNSGEYLGQTFTFTVVGTSATSTCSTTFSMHVLDV